ncbi:MAG: non-ribosomal peptide synthetase [Myxacorys chilensis ATA2-1-KO14]|nr:non-ribosomal peptide synthetase [Myxacorys chilensis ATA2-1-KO14]
MTPFPDSVQAWFFAVADKQPDAVAVVTDDQTLTYSELSCRSRGVVSALKSKGVQPGTIVAIFCPEPADFIVALIGVLAAGGVPCPLDTTWPMRRLIQLLEITTPAFGIVGLGHGNALKTMAPTWQPMEIVELNPNFPKDGDAPSWTPHPDSPCYVFFTSGSSGRPKGIVGRTIAVTHFIDWEIRTFGVTTTDVIPMLTSPGFDAVLRDIFTPLCAGGRIIAPVNRELLIDAEALAVWLGHKGATLWHTTPSLLRSVLRCNKASSLPNLRLGLTAGEPLLPSDIEAWFAVFGDRAELVNFYGPSETTMIKMFHRITYQDMQRARVPIGRPIDGCRAIILDSAGAPAGVGIVDEIYLRTPYRSLGYLGQPDQTVKVFVPNPLTNSADDIVYRTGDLGRMDEDGVFEFFGRVDWQLKIRGVRVEPSEVEDVLRRHADVLDITVVGYAFEDSELQLCAYVVLRENASIDAIRAFGAERLLDAMVPTVFVPLPVIPRNSNGKVERLALPDPRDIVLKAEYIAPRTPIEQAVVDILMEVLEIDKVSVTDSFFSVGGHSLLIMRVLSRIEEAFGIAIPISDVLVKPTAETMAALIETSLEGQSQVDAELQALIDEVACEIIEM